MALLYKNIIDDEGAPGDIEKLMMQLNEEARRALEQYENLNEKRGAAKDSGSPSPPQRSLEEVGDKLKQHFSKALLVPAQNVTPEQAAKDNATM